MNLPVDEIFYGLQGEGNRMGFPSVFIRTGGCNLTCKGFGCEITAPSGEVITGCDTIHAVNVKHFSHLWEHYNSFQQLVETVMDLLPKALEHNETERADIVFTGGEPLIHHKNPVMVDTVSYFISRGHKVFFETNGTVEIDFSAFPIYKRCSMSMSVKMSASGEPIQKRWKEGVVDEYISNTEGSYFKFVLSKGSIENEAREIFDFLQGVPSYAPVYCMPLGENWEQVRENAFDVYEFASANGFRYSDRLHIRIHNDKRGV